LSFVRHGGNFVCTAAVAFFLAHFHLRTNFMPGVSPRFAFAVAQHRSGNYQQAESVYRELLAGDPHGGIQTTPMSCTCSA